MQPGGERKDWAVHVEPEHRVGNLDCSSVPHCVFLPDGRSEKLTAEDIRMRDGQTRCNCSIGLNAGSAEEGEPGECYAGLLLTSSLGPPYTIPGRQTEDVSF